MAIRISKSLYNQKTVDSTPSANEPGALGFNIKFTDGVTYNLDELVALHNFADGSTPLVIEVKRDLAEKAIEEMRDVLNYNISTSLVDQSVTDAVYEEIKAVFRQYHYCYNSVTEEFYLEKVHNSSIPINAYKDLNKRINRVLNEFYNNNNIAYTISFDNRQAGEPYTITYNYISPDSLKTEFAYYYDQFIIEYEKKMVVENEGGLAIDANKGKTHVTKNDFSQYLLSDDPSSSMDETTYNQGERAVKVIWECGPDEDEREQDELPENMYDMIQNMNDKLNSQKELLEEYLNNELNKIGFSDDEVKENYIVDLHDKNDPNYDPLYVPTGRECPNCGTVKEEGVSGKWVCPDCGQLVTGKYVMILSDED